MNNSTNIEPLVLTVEETAEALQVGESLVYNLVRSGKLRSLHIGRKIRVPRSALSEYLNSSI